MGEEQCSEFRVGQPWEKRIFPFGVSLGVGKIILKNRGVKLTKLLLSWKGRSFSNIFCTCQIGMFSVQVGKIIVIILLPRRGIFFEGGGWLGYFLG